MTDKGEKLKPCIAESRYRNDSPLDRDIRNVTKDCPLRCTPAEDVGATMDGLLLQIVNRLTTMIHNRISLSTFWKTGPEETAENVGGVECTCNLICPVHSPQACGPKPTAQDEGELPQTLNRADGSWVHKDHMDEAQSEIASLQAKLAEYEEHTGTLGRSLALLKENNELKEKVAEKDKRIEELIAKCIAREEENEAGQENYNILNAKLKKANAVVEALRKISDKEGDCGWPAECNRCTGSDFTGGKNNCDAAVAKAALDKLEEEE